MDLHQDALYGGAPYPDSFYDNICFKGNVLNQWPKSQTIWDTVMSINEYIDLLYFFYISGRLKSVVFLFCREIP